MSHASDDRFIIAPDLCPPANEPQAFGAPPVVRLDRIHVSQDYLSADVAAKFSIGFGLGGGAVDAGSRAFILVYEAMVESAATSRVLDQEIWDEVQAIGVQVQIKVTESKASVKFDAFAVAAAVQLGLAKAEFQTLVLPSDAAALQNLVPIDGAFNMDTFELILVGIGKVKNSLGDNAAALLPRRHHRPRGLLSSLESDLATSQAIAFAMRELAKSKYVETAVEDAADKHLDPTLIRLVYQSRWPATHEHTNPSGDVIKSARAWVADPLGL